MSTKIQQGMIATDRDVFMARQKITSVLEPIFFRKVATMIKDARESGAERWGEFILPTRPTPASSVPAEGGRLLSVPRESLAALLRYPIDKADAPSAYQAIRQALAIVESLRNQERITLSKYDFGYKVSMMPNGLGPRHFPLVLLFSEFGDEYRKALRKAGVVERYGYWDNVDQPDDLSASDWRKRKRAWSPTGALGWGAPSEVDLQILTPSGFRAEVAIAELL